MNEQIPFAKGMREIVQLEYTRYNSDLAWRVSTTAEGTRKIGWLRKENFAAAARGAIVVIGWNLHSNICDDDDEKLTCLSVSALRLGSSRTASKLVGIRKLTCARASCVCVCVW